MRREIIGYTRSGLPLYLIAGADGDPAPPKPTEDPATPPAKAYSQEELNRIAAAEKEQGKRAAERDLADKLGVSLDEAADIIKQHREREEQNKTELDKAQSAAEREKAQREAVERERDLAKHDARLLEALVTAEVPAKKLGHVKKLVEVAPGASDEELAQAIAKVKEDVPELFAEQEAGDGKPAPKGTPPAPGSDPKGTPPAPKPGDDAMKRGMERAKAYSSGEREYTFSGLTGGSG